MTASLPSFAQIQHVKQLLGTDLFGPTTIAKLTGVPLRDVFRIGSVPLHRGCLRPPLGRSALPRSSEVRPDHRQAILSAR